MLKVVLVFLLCVFLYADEDKKYIDPYTLVFAYTPNENPASYRSAWKDFILYLEKVTGKNVVFFPYQTNMAEVKAMKAGFLHIAGFSTGTVPIAVKKAGFVPMYVMADKNNNYGYKMVVITYPKSGINSLKEIRGKTLALTSPSSNSGCRAILKLLQKRYHYKKNQDYFVNFSGRHGKSILGVANKKYKVAAVASSVLNRMIKSKKLAPNSIKVIFQSKKFPTTGYGYVKNLKPELIQKIKYAFESFKWTNKDGTKTSLKKRFITHDKFLKIDYKQVWTNVIKQ